MSIRASSRILLTLLVMTAHLMGVTASAAPVINSTDAVYFCCCLGECSCTGDCCNHGPELDSNDDLGGVRVGPATPALQSPKNCGVWLATAQRSPEQPSDARTDAPQWPLAGPDQTGPRDSAPPLIPSNESFLRDLSPRAPPTDRVLS